MISARPHLIPLIAVSAVMALALTGCATPAAPADQARLTTSQSPVSGAAYDAAFENLEADFDARLGVYAIDTGTGEEVMFRAEERFAFASTYKALAAAAVLEQNTLDELEEVITFDVADLVSYSPVTEQAAGTGMTLRDLAVAAVQYSDNTAGNLLFDELDGPAGFDAALESLGDDTTVAERRETDLNDYAPGDDSDTSTPRALATTLATYALGDVLDMEKRDLFAQWLVGNTTGDNLIRAAVPSDWVVGDKTGAAAYGTRNDIAVLWPTDGAPIVIAILSDKTDPDAQHDDALIADAARIIVNTLKE